MASAGTMAILIRGTARSSPVTTMLCFNEWQTMCMQRKYRYVRYRRRTEVIVQAAMAKWWLGLFMGVSFERESTSDRIDQALDERRRAFIGMQERARQSRQINIMVTRSNDPSCWVILVVLR
jgi:hypothetical protein